MLGATHPHVKERHGEAYRHSLEILARKLGVQANIIFHDRFVSLRELTDFLSAADIYITPYLNPEQITSGTLAYAVGAGKAVISTPYRYARELLADDRGVLVPFKDSAAIAVALNDLLDDRDKLCALGERAAAYGRDMVWPSVARRYVESMERAVNEQASLRRSFFEAKTLAKRPVDLPELNIEHLRVMTDDTGMLQHARFSIPRYEDGYCLDDNARALLLMSLVEDSGTEDPASARALTIALPGVRQPRVQPRSPAFPQFHDVLPQVDGGLRVGGQPRARIVGAGSGGRSFDGAGTPKSQRQLVSCRTAVDSELHEPAGLGFDPARHQRVPARISGRKQRRSAAKAALGATLVAVQGEGSRRLAVVRG